MLPLGCASRSTEAQQSPPSPDPTPDLTAAILGMHEHDQELQRELFEDQPDEVRASELMVEIQRVQADNAEEFWALVQEHGWPTRSRVGEEAATAAAYLAAHAPVHYQRRYLAEIEDAFERGEASGLALAMLTDTLRITDGQPQVYGTQQSCTDEGEVDLGPVEDSERLEQRRQKLGLPALGPSLEAMRQFCGSAAAS